MPGLVGLVAPARDAVTAWTSKLATAEATLCALGVWNDQPLQTGLVATLAGLLLPNHKLGELLLAHPCYGTEAAGAKAMERAARSLLKVKSGDAKAAKRPGNVPRQRFFFASNAPTLFTYGLLQADPAQAVHSRAPLLTEVETLGLNTAVVTGPRGAAAASSAAAVDVDASTSTGEEDELQQANELILRLRAAAVEAAAHGGMC